MYFCFMGREIRARKYRLVPKAGLGYPLGHRLFFFFCFFFKFNLCCENSCRTSACKSKVRYAIILKLRKLQTVFSEISLESLSM